MMIKAKHGTAPPAVSIAEPTAAVAERLWRCYEKAYRNDEDLLRRVCSPDEGEGIDGLTEKISPEEIQAVMNRPDTVVFERQSGEESSGFLIAAYASKERASRERFQTYFLSEVFRLDDLQFLADGLDRDFSDVLEQGEIVYFAEFVSTGGRTASASLVMAAYEEICLRRFRTPTCTMVGKCLDSVRIGSCENRLGNRPVKAMAEALGLRKIARCDQTRPLDINHSSDLLLRAFPDKNHQSDRTAILTFALYLGDAKAAIEAIAHRS